jgi:hypothetical protein
MANQDRERRKRRPAPPVRASDPQKPGDAVEPGRAAPSDATGSAETDPVGSTRESPAPSPDDRGSMKGTRGGL